MTETHFKPDSPVGKLWQDIQDFYVSKKNISLEQLEAEVNVGYISDPLWTRKFTNITDKTESSEVLGWCYAHEDCHPLLAKHNFPVFFAMNDFNPENWVDDQKRHEIRRKIEALDLASVSDFEKRARQVFSWSLGSMQFYNDCPVESPDWLALMNHCGACTESTSAMYYVYRVAGFDPQFYYETDWKPSMRWQDRYEKIGTSFMDHVLLGLPKKDGSVLFVDRINEEFDGSHEQAVPVFPLAFAAAVMMNPIQELTTMGGEENLPALLETQNAMIPEDLFVYFQKATLLRGQGKKKEGLEMMEAIPVLFPEHPAGPLLNHLFHLSGEKIYDELSNDQSELNMQLRGLEAKAPRLAAHVLIMIGSTLMGEARRIAPSVQKAMKLGAVAQDYFKQFESLLQLNIKLFAMALKNNPNAVKAYVGMMKIFDEYHLGVPGINEYIADICAILIDQNPGHTPLHYLRGLVEGTRSYSEKNGDKRKEQVKEAAGHFDAIIALEPEHPLAYLKQAKADRLLGKTKKMFSRLGTYKELQKENWHKDFYLLQIEFYSNEQDEEGFKKVLEELLVDHPLEGPKIFSSYLKENLGLQLAGKLPSREEFVDGEGHAFMKGIMIFVEDLLQSYPSVQDDLQAVRAKLAIVSALKEGGTAWEESFAAIKEPGSQTIVTSFRESLVALDRWLSVQYQNEDIVDWLFETMEILRKDLPGVLQGDILSIYVELINNYVSLGEKMKANTVWKKMLSLDETKAVVLYAQRVINLPYNTLESRIMALDLVYEHREQIAPELLHRLREAYVTVLDHLDENSKFREDIQNKIAVLE